ncbi:MAG: ABC transporter permease [Halobacteriales archaeon]
MNWLRSGRDLIARLVDASARERLVISIAALIASLILGALIVLVSGFAATCDQPFLTTGAGTFCYDPFEVYFQLFVSPFLSPFNLSVMLKEVTLLLLTGLSVAVAFRAGLFNIGTQGQLVFGGLGTALAVLWAAPLAPSGIAGAVVLVSLGLACGAGVGGLYGAIPGLLKAYAEANEVITTIMLNFIAINTAFYLVSTFFQDPTSQSIETRSLPVVAQLRPVIPAFAGSSFSVLALTGALVLVGLVYFLLFHTAIGYDLRTSGLQPSAARYGGVDSPRMIVTSMTLSGALGGLGGAVYVMMVLGRWRTGVPPIGFDGITVSILASNNPLGVLPAAVLFGIMKSGSLSINFALGVPKQLVAVLRGLVILFVAMPEFFRMLGRYLGIERTDRTLTAGGGGPSERGDDARE